jgi:CheY-like chemotaxis protein
MLNKSALIIDDSATARTMLKHKLHRFDVMVESAADGFEALDLLQTHQPDVIFLDHIMPGMDGFQVLDQLKSNPLTQAIPVVMYTSQAAPKYTIEAMALGAVGVMPKQVSNSLLSQMLDKAERYQQGLVFSESPIQKDSAGTSSLPRPPQDTASSVDPELAATQDLVEECSDKATTQKLNSSTSRPSKATSPVMSLMILVVLLAQGYSFFTGQQQQQLISSMENELSYQQHQYRLVSRELSEQSEANQATLEQFQFVMDAVVTEVLNNNAGQTETTASIASYEQAEMSGDTFALALE